MANGSRILDHGMALGERIKSRRLELEWTQDALAQKAGISKGFLSDVENGKRGVGADTLLDIARVLGMSLDYLMKGTPDERAARSEVEIPHALAELADANSLSFRQTLTLLQMQRQIVAHRSAASAERTSFDWARFYESVKEFLR
jgi:transcriptional regulator with XRE-family HTH domain